MASPMKLNDRTASITAAAGKVQDGRVEQMGTGVIEHGPQLAVGGGTPRPRKLMVASARIAPAMPIAACTRPAE